MIKCLCIFNAIPKASIIQFTDAEIEAWRS